MKNKQKELLELPFEWQNLLEGRCPKCNCKIYTPWKGTKAGKLCFCKAKGCKFAIGTEKMMEIIKTLTELPPTK